MFEPRPGPKGRGGCAPIRATCAPRAQRGSEWDPIAPFPTIRCNSFSIHGSLRKRIYEQWRLSERHELDTANHVHGRDAAPGQVSFFAPIILSNELCLKCHGEPGKDIAPEHAALIDELYTEDQAKGFKLGQLRGAWRVDFPMAAFDQPAR